MTITTKFDIGQLVWYIEGNRVQKGTVYKMSVMKFKDTQNETYGVTLGSGVIDRSVDVLFATKEELIKSID